MPGKRGSGLLQNRANEWKVCQNCGENCVSRQQPNGRIIGDEEWAERRFCGARCASEARKTRRRV